MQSAQVIACSKVITLHMMQSRQPTALYNPHKGIVNCVHINHTNKVIASCGQDGRIVLVDASKPDNEVFETSFHSSGSSHTVKPVSVNCVMFSSQSNYIAAGSSDCLVKIWNLKDRKQPFSTIKSHLASVNSLAWIKKLPIDKLQGQILASASSIGDIFLHSVNTSNIVETLNSKNQQSINQIKVSESEGHCRLAACTATGSVMAWNLRNLQKDTNPMCHFNNGKKSSVTSVSFSLFNPTLLAASSMDETLTFYDVNQKKAIKVINSEQPLTSINFHKDGHTLVGGGMYGGLFVYDLRKPVKPREKLTGHDSAIKCTVFIKEPELSTQTMSTSRASKTSSVTSYNSKAQSSKSVHEDAKEVKLNNFVEQNKKAELSSQMIQQKNKQRISREPIQNRKESVGVKLYSTGQQAIKNAQTKPGVSRTNPATTAPTGYTYYNKPPTESNSAANLPKANQYSIPKPGYSQEVSQIKPPGNQLTKQSLSTSIGVDSSTVQQLKDLIEERFQNLHMEMIHQFHLQQKDMKQMISTLLIEDKKKTEQIKDLQEQIKHLKYNTY